MQTLQGRVANVTVTNVVDRAFLDKMSDLLLDERGRIVPPRFYDVSVRDAVIRERRFTAGIFHVRKWDHAEIAAYEKRHRRWRRFGRILRRKAPPDRTSLWLGIDAR